MKHEPQFIYQIESPEQNINLQITKSFFLNKICYKAVLKLIWYLYFYFYLDGS